MQLYRDFNSYLREIFDCRVQKITLDAGLTCPNRDGRLGRGGCIYCNPRGSGTAAGDRQGSAERIQSAKSRLVKRYKAKKFLAYFQSFSNTYAPLSQLKRLYAEALEDRDVVGLSIGTRPDCLPEEILRHLTQLAREHLIWLELGLQSAKDETLKRINRGHSAAQFSEATARCQVRGLPVCAHVILGLPGETREDMLETARFLNGTGVDAVKIHLLYVIRGTPLHELYRNGDYRCLDRREYAGLVGEFLSRLGSNTIIQRLTGDPHPEELIAPEWALHKQKTLETIQRSMQENKRFQGSSLEAAPLQGRKWP